MYGGDHLRDLGFHGQFGLLDLFDPLIAFYGQTRQILPEAHHAVVGGAVCALFDAVVFGHPPCLLFTLPEGISEIIRSNTVLVREWPSLGTAEHVTIMCKASLDISAVSLAVQKCH
ncbi:hypothetical protein [Mycobacterium lentiflavum]|uniref:hypothetical protein n=1 Tax=Mycobacterium lentiflavum TaxID=141349 RepID=UPI000B837D7F|nr:hypothetical protein [Mycobacterium lentiflavum]